MAQTVHPAMLDASPFASALIVLGDAPIIERFAIFVGENAFIFSILGERAYDFQRSLAERNRTNRTPCLRTGLYFAGRLERVERSSPN